MQQSRIEEIKAIFCFLLEKFTNFAYIEKNLQLPSDTLKKWYDKPELVNDVEFALLSILRINPEVINKLDIQNDKQINTGIYFMTNDGCKVRKINLDETNLSVITIDETLVVIGDKTVRVSVNEKKTIHKQNEVFITR